MKLFTSLLFLSSFVYATETEDMKFYQKIFPNITKIKSVKIPDPISEAPINTELKLVFNNESLLGYIREISTTTGCNSACLPLNYTTFYSADGKFKSLKSRDGLTKKNHAPMSAEDYSRLEMIVLLAPKRFDSIKHPKELTDAISGETFKQYQDIVVKEAAYSTLRVHVYNQQTQKAIKNLKAVQKLP